MAKGQSKLKTEGLDTEDELDELVKALARPMFLYRMAYGVATDEFYGDRLVKGARTKLKNSRREIDDIVRAYVAGEPLDEWT